MTSDLFNDSVSVSYSWTFRRRLILYTPMIRQFLCDRPQRVRLNGLMCRDPVLSDEIVVNTGAPQGCVLSAVLFSLHTNDILSNKSFLTLFKYADDIPLVCCLKDELSVFEYLPQIKALSL